MFCCRDLLASGAGWHLLPVQSDAALPRLHRFHHFHRIHRLHDESEATGNLESNMPADVCVIETLERGNSQFENVGNRDSPALTYLLTSLLSLA